jgi:hypothetical protein
MLGNLELLRVFYYGSDGQHSTEVNCRRWDAEAMKNGELVRLDRYFRRHGWTDCGCKDDSRR